MTPQGVVRALPLTHEFLGVSPLPSPADYSSAPQRLVRAGEIARWAYGGWTLLGQPPARATAGDGQSMLAA